MSIFDELVERRRRWARRAIEMCVSAVRVAKRDARECQHGGLTFAHAAKKKRWIRYKRTPRAALVGSVSMDGKVVLVVISVFGPATIASRRDACASLSPASRNPDFPETSQSSKEDRFLHSVQNQGESIPSRSRPRPLAQSPPTVYCVERSRAGGRDCIVVASRECLVL